MATKQTSPPVAKTAAEAQPTPTPKLAYKTRSGSDYGVPTTFDSTKYDISKLTYPEDLLGNTDQYGGNYVIFYVNVQEDSKLINQLKYETITDQSAVPPRLRGDAIALNTTAAEGIAVSGVTATLGGGILKAVGAPKATPAAAGAVGLGTGYAASTTAAGFNRPQKRLKQAIALHMPEDLNIKYGMQWESQDTALAAAAFTISGQAAETFNKAKKSGIGQSVMADAAKSKGKDLLQGGGTYAALKTPGTGDYTSVQTGLATNPKKEQIFRGVNYRDFQLNYRFFARSEQEAKQIQEIITAFKLHMHPEFKDAYNFIYIYPSEFDIYYYQNGVENMHIHRHTSCVLTDLSVSYTPNGMFMAFEDGTPTQINIQLTFKELALLTKDNILDGF